MKSQIALHNHPIRIILSIGLFLLAACGTFEVGLEPDLEQEGVQIDLTRPVTTPQAEEGSLSSTVDDVITPTPEPTSLDSGELFEFVSYVHPDLGYQLLVPNGATMEQSADGLDTSFLYVEEARTFTLEVKLFPEIPEPVGDSAEAFVRWATGESTAPVMSTVADDGALSGAAVHSLEGAGTWCEQLRVQHTGFIVEAQGYVISIRSDAPNFCDAETIPETHSLTSSFRVPILGEGEVVEGSTSGRPTPTPITEAPSLQVAYNKNNNVWLWNEESGPVALTKNGGVESVMLSDDGQRIAFRRGDNIWVVNSDGSGERQLTTEANFEGISFGADWDPYVISVTPYEMAWRPGTHTLFFNTAPQLEGPGLMLTDDLWSINTDTGELVALLPVGDGGKLAISPDGQHIAITTPGSISLLDGDGHHKREVFTYTPIITYSEFQYYAQPIWAADSSALAVAIPPVDHMASPDQLTSIWHLPTDGPPARLIGHVSTKSNIPAQTLIAPDLNRVAYLVGESQDTPPIFQVAISEISEAGIEAPVFYPSQAETLDSWSPDAFHFVFTPPYNGVAPQRFISDLGGESVPIGDGETTVFDVSWVDETSYLYLWHGGGRGWVILLGYLDGEEAMAIDAVVGPPPSYDFAGS